MCQRLIWVTAIYQLLGSASSDVVNLVPQVTTVTVGDSAKFVCSPPPASSVDWKFRPIGSMKIQDVYSHIGSIHPAYVQDVKVQNNGTVLLIELVTAPYAGTFYCVATDQKESTASSELVVLLGSAPECRYDSQSVFIGENTCGVDQSHVRLSCTISYAGNVAPHMQWWSARTQELISTVAPNISSGSTAVYSLVLTTNRKMDGDSFVCRLDDKYSCRTAPIDVLYAGDSADYQLVTTSDPPIGCSIDASRHLKSQCSFSWKKQQSGETFADGEQIRLNDEQSPGEHFQCSAVCKFGGRDCVLKGTTVAIGQGGVARANVAAIVIGCVLGFIILLLIAGILYVWFRRRKNSQYDPTQDVELSKNADESTTPFLSDKQSVKVKPALDRVNSHEKGDVKQTTGKLREGSLKSSGRLFQSVGPEVASAKLDSTSSTEKGNDTSKKTLDTKPESMETSVQLPDKGNLIGIAFLQNKIYICSYIFKKILVFSDQAPHREFEEDKITLDKIEQPDDLASCTTCQAIFISDYSNNKFVHKIEILGKKSRMWKMDGKPSKLSTTGSGQLLVIVRGDKEVFMEIYKTTDMTKLRTVHFPPDIFRPVKAIENSRGNFVVLYRTATKQDFVGEFSEKEGRVVVSMNLSQHRSSWSDPLSHVALGKDDAVYIADTENSKMFRLDSRMSSCESFRKFDQPYRVCYSPEKHILIVGKWDPGTFTVITNV